MPTHELTLASATPTNGMRLVAAGGGMSARLTEALDVNVGAVAGQANGVCIDPDGLHVWVDRRANNDVRKIRISDQVVIATFTNNVSDSGARTIASPEGLTRMPGSTKVYVANAGANNWIVEIDTATLVCRIYSNAVVTAPTHVVQGEAGKVWIGAANGSARTYTEVSLAGTGDAAAVTATGRTITNAFDLVADGAGFLYHTQSTSVVKYRLSDGTAVATITNLNTIYQGVPGYGSAWRSLAWDVQNQRLLVHPVNAGTEAWWYRCNFSGTPAIDGACFGPAEFGAPIPNYSTIYQRAGIAWSDDGLTMAFLTFNAGATAAASQTVRVVSLKAQRATWTWTPGVPVVISSIGVPGSSGNRKGAIENVPNAPAFLTGTYDWQYTTYFYSISGGASDVPFDPSNRLSISMPNGTETLTVYIVIQRKSDMPWGPRPYIGSVDGTGPLINFDIPQPALRVVGGI